MAYSISSALFSAIKHLCPYPIGISDSSICKNYYKTMALSGKALYLCTIKKRNPSHTKSTNHKLKFEKPCQ